MILKEKVIVILGNTRFDGNIKSTSLFIARNLAKYNKVFFLDHPFTVKDYINYSKKGNLKQRKGKFSMYSDGIISTDIDNLKIVITPVMIPVNFLAEGILFRSLLKINELLITNRLKKILKTEKVTDFIYINSFNFHYPNLSKFLKPRLSIYHCVDPMIMPYDMKHGVKSEYQLVKESDVVICTSKALADEKRLINRNTYFIANATSLEHISTADNHTMLVHPKTTVLKKPIIGYVGTIERRIDYELLLEVVKQNMDKTFVLAGPVDEGYLSEKLFESDNLFALGPIPYEEVPQLVNSFDIAIIPFKKDNVSKTIFPIKLFEYMSLGIQVIATDFNLDLKDFTKDLVPYCPDALTFSEAIDDCLTNNTPEKINQRKALANENTWERRSEDFAAIIQSHLTASLP